MLCLYTVQAAEDDRLSGDGQGMDIQLRQNMLRSHPVLDSRAASPHNDTPDLVHPSCHATTAILSISMSNVEVACTHEAFHGSIIPRRNGSLQCLWLGNELPICCDYLAAHNAREHESS